MQLDAGAFTLALHPGVIVNGVAGQTVGTLPTSLNVNTTDHIHFTITFSGTDGSTVNVGADYTTIIDGVYDLHVSASLVHPLGVPTVHMTAETLDFDGEGSIRVDSGEYYAAFERDSRTDRLHERGSLFRSRNRQSPCDINSLDRRCTMQSVRSGHFVDMHWL